MADFDQLIKDKVDGAKYPYKSSAWKRFAHKAGFKAVMTPLIKVILSVTTVAVIGGGTLGIVSAVRHQQSTVEPTAQSTQDSTATVKTTVKAISIVSSNASAPEKEVDSQITPTSKIATIDVFPPATENVKTTAQKKTVYGRPLIINPDTIKTNEPTEEQIRNGHSRIVEQ